jgi:hypothetical protein
MFEFFRHGHFVIPPIVAVGMVAVVSVALFMMVIASAETRVRTADARCEVGEIMPGSETIRVKLECKETSGVTSTSTSQAATVVTILQNKPTTVVCNVMHTGWARDCRMP